MNVPAGKGYVSRGSLPSNWKHAGMDARKEKKKRLPQWFWHEPTLKRILGVYADYLACKTLPFICEKYQISITQVYRDIDAAQQEAKLRADLEIETLSAQAVEMRRSIIAQAQSTLEEMRDEMIAGPNRAQAEAQLLRVIADQQTAIENIQTVTESRRRILNPPEGQVTGVPHPSSPSGVTLIINATGVKTVDPEVLAAQVNNVLNLPPPNTEDDEELPEGSFEQE